MTIKNSLIFSLLYLAARGHACDESENAIAASTVTNTGTVTATTFVTSVRPTAGDAPSPAAVAAGTGCLLYTVHAQDTGYAIAQSFGLEFTALNTSNPGITWEKLEAGSQILIPAGYTTQPSLGVSPANSCSEPPPKTAADIATPPASVVSPNAVSAASIAPVSVAVVPPPPPPPATNPLPAVTVQNSAPSAATVPSTAAAAPVAAATAASQFATAATSGCKTYTVVQGDTGYEIAQAVGITLAELNAQNPGMVWEKMEVGQILTLPPKATGANLGTSPDCKPAAIVAAPVGGTSGSGNAPPPPPAAATTPPAAVASGSAANSAPPSAAATAAQTVGAGGAEPVSALTHMGAVTDCSNAEYKNECVPAKDAAPHILAGFTKYGITTPGEQAALLSLMIFESGGFKYQKKHFPTPVPGQGTINMMSYEFVEKYVQSLSTELNGASKGEPDVMLGLVLKPEYSFASAAWFYSGACTGAVKDGVKRGTAKGYEAYLKECVKTEVTPERMAGFDKARAALGVPIA